jgi:hypothetical protein
VRIQTGFDPQVHGFQFTNRFAGGSVVAELAAQDRLSQLSGLKVPRAVRQLTDLAAGADFWGSFGLCGGMSWTALDRYRKGEPIADTRAIPERDTGLFRSLVTRQADSMSGRALLERCLLWQFLPDRAPWWMFWAKGVGRLTVEEEWPKLRHLLDSGEPTSLVLIRNQGIASPGDHHQVLAIGYETSNGAATIELYDPNHPRRRPTIPLDLEAQMCGPRQSTGERTRGFFVWAPDHRGNMSA